jgi:cytochrome d ubiquinol oxidase subunit II
VSDVLALPPPRCCAPRAPHLCDGHQLRQLQPNVLLSLALFALGFAGLGVSVFPYAVPDEITLWQAAAPASSQLFMLVGALILIPIILAYTAYAYWVFRGKVGDDGYH